MSDASAKSSDISRLALLRQLPIAERALLAILVELTAVPKPGNITPLHEKPQKRFEDFLSSAVALRTVFEKAASLATFQDRVGVLILDGVKAMLASQPGGNTLLGAILLLVPLCAAHHYIKGASAREASQLLVELMKSTSPRDAIFVYRAIRTANPRGLGHVEAFDVLDPASEDRILAERKNLYDVMQLAADRDLVAHELANGYSICLSKALPLATRVLQVTTSLRTTAAQVAIFLLATYPDSHIARVHGFQTAQLVQRRAQKIWAAGGVLSPDGWRKLWELDWFLTRGGLNPGATADLVAATTFFLLLGVRP